MQSIGGWVGSRWMAILPAAVFVVAVAVHLPAVQNGFVFDDDLLIVGNERVHGLDHIGEIFSSAFWPGHTLYYRPLVLLTFALNHAAGDLDAFGYHLVDVLLHALNAVLVTLLAGALMRHRIAAAVAGLLFAVHPLLTEAVYWVSSRSDLLATFFILLGLLVHRRRLLAEAGGASGRWRQTAPAALCLFLGLLSKETALLLPLLWLLLDGWAAKFGGLFPSFRPKALALRHGPPLIALLAYCALRLAAFDGSLGATGDQASELHNPLYGADVATRALAPMALLTHATTLVVWPAVLSSDYCRNAIPLPASAGDPRVLIGIAILLAIAALAAGSARRTGGYLAAVGLGVVAYLPTSNTFVLSGALFGERFLYLPFVGGVLLAGGLAAGAWTRRDAFRPVIRSAVVVVVLAALILMAMRSNERSSDWSDTETLYISALRAYPENAQAQYNRGVLLFEQSARKTQSGYDRTLLARAEMHFRRAMEIFPKYLLAHLNAGVTRCRLGDWHGGSALFQRALTIDDRDPRVHFNLGLAYEKTGDSTMARRHYSRSSELMGGEGPGAIALKRLDDGGD